MEDIYNLIRTFNNDENVIKLKNYYSSCSFMEILGVDRNETVHSSFLAWLFNSKVNYDLINKPLIMLLDLLIKSDNKNKFPNNDIDSIILRQADIKMDFVKSEYSIKPDGRVDIYIQFSIGKNQYAIVIENKVEAVENEEKEKGIMQTEKYFQHFSKEKTNIKYIYVFLAPSFKGKVVQASCEEFINITYNDIVKYIIQPLLFDDNLLMKTRIILEDYLKVLSKPNIVNSNSKSINMVDLDTLGYETNLINNIKNNNKDLGIKLKQNIDNPVLKEFMENQLNNIIVTIVWKEILTKKNRNRTFNELGIEEGSILYLSESEQNNILNKKIFVRTEDNINQVSYIDVNGQRQYGAISKVARILKGLNYNVNGFKFFVYYDGKTYINLSKMNRKKH